MREALHVGSPIVRPLGDGRWEARLETIDVRAIGRTDKDARTALRSLIVARINAMTEDERDAYLLSLPVHFTEDECRSDGYLGEMFDADGNPIVRPSPHLRPL